MGADPRLVDAAADYHVQAGSPAIGRGAAVMGVTADYYGAGQAGVMLPMILVLAAIHVAMPIAERAAPREAWVQRVDLAYTRNTKADHSVALVLAEKAGVFYVLDTVRERMSAPAFAERLKHLRTAYPGAPMRWIAAGTEVGAADFLKVDGLPLTVDAATTDKFVRSIDVAAAWNAGKVLLPSKCPAWVPPLLDEVGAFTGQNDLCDDQVDALAAAHRALTQGFLPRTSDRTETNRRRL